jgi:hypothetical protein
MIRNLEYANKKVGEAVLDVTYIPSLSLTSTLTLEAGSQYPLCVVESGIVSLSPSQIQVDVLDTVRNDLMASGNSDAAASVLQAQNILRSAPSVVCSPFPFSKKSTSCSVTYNQNVEALKIDIDVDGIRGLVSGEMAAELFFKGNTARMVDYFPSAKSGCLSQLFVRVLSSPQKLWIRKEDATR